MAHFKRITCEAREGMRNAVIQGRRTWESAEVQGRALPRRLNIIISRSAQTLPDGVLAARSLDEALAITAASRFPTAPSAAASPATGAASATALSAAASPATGASATALSAAASPATGAASATASSATASPATRASSTASSATASSATASSAQASSAASSAGALSAMTSSALVGSGSGTDIDTTFVIGGAQIFREAFDHAELRYIYLTRVLARFECDAFLPNLDEKGFVAVEWSGAFEGEDNGVRYRVERLARR
jgi:dihydrofolate reductase